MNIAQRLKSQPPIKIQKIHEGMAHYRKEIEEMLRQRIVGKCPFHRLALLTSSIFVSFVIIESGQGRERSLYQEEGESPRYLRCSSGLHTFLCLY
jgi:hypothetical protein